jgi:Ca2+-dependent lipid-binding protein
MYDLEDTLLDERKIEKQPMTFDPQWNEEILFALNGRPTDLLQVAIRIHELDSFSNEHVIGEVKMPLTEFNLGKPGNMWYDLTDINKVMY